MAMQGAAASSRASITLGMAHVIAFSLVLNPCHMERGRSRVGG